MYSKFVYILVDQSDKIGWKMADYYFKLCTWLYLLSGSLILQRWARAYRDTKYHASVETNNGAEALNRLLKYQYLPRKRKMTLSNIICTIIEQFIPALHYKYIYQNFKQSDLYIQIVQSCSSSIVSSRSTKIYNFALPPQTSKQQQIHRVND